MGTPIRNVHNSYSPKHLRNFQVVLCPMPRDTGVPRRIRDPRRDYLRLQTKAHSGLRNTVKPEPMIKVIYGDRASSQRYGIVSDGSDILGRE